MITRSEEPESVQPGCDQEHQAARSECWQMSQDSLLDEQSFTTVKVGVAEASVEESHSGEWYLPTMMHLPAPVGSEGKDTGIVTVPLSTQDMQQECGAGSDLDASIVLAWAEAIRFTALELNEGDSRHKCSLTPRRELTHGWHSPLFIN
ncbi:hypothetical protein NDU88_004288 [Pleurodeles waltl]|uniref:Uncharacterized protein n=1 Tax=Pleurodeles waltl TaxID=8319 RepID=A0AAV7QBI0_PLEWA|nr:hypothetical protein NDU88_004288 [Pleurodeles waltl]